MFVDEWINYQQGQEAAIEYEQKPLHIFWLVKYRQFLFHLILSFSPIRKVLKKRPYKDDDQIDYPYRQSDIESLPITGDRLMGQNHFSLFFFHSDSTSHNSLNRQAGQTQERLGIKKEHD